MAYRIWQSGDALLIQGNGSIELSREDASSLMGELRAFAIGDGTNHNKRWTPEDNAELRKLVESGVKGRQLAEKLGRSASAIMHHRGKLGLHTGSAKQIANGPRLMAAARRLK